MCPRPTAPPQRRRKNRAPRLCRPLPSRALELAHWLQRAIVLPQPNAAAAVAVAVVALAVRILVLPLVLVRARDLVPDRVIVAAEEAIARARLLDAAAAVALRLAVRDSTIDSTDATAAKDPLEVAALREDTVAIAACLAVALPLLQEPQPQPQLEDRSVVEATRALLLRAVVTHDLDLARTLARAVAVLVAAVALDRVRAVQEASAVDGATNPPRRPQARRRSCCWVSRRARRPMRAALLRVPDALTMTTAATTRLVQTPTRTSPCLLCSPSIRV